MHPYLNTAIKAARSAGNIISRSMDRLDRVEISTKSSANDYVTSVDRAAEAEIIAIINKAYPDHGILGEETGAHAGTNIGDVTWIIDPIDGTCNFVHGFPFFCVSIGVQVKGVMEHGVVYNPVSNELFTATRGSGAQLDGRRIRVSENKNIETALIATGDTLSFNTVRESCGDIRWSGSAALHLAFVAAGRLDAYLEKGLKPWDVAAGSLLVREAGGFVGDYRGSDVFLDKGEIVAGNTKIYPELINLIKTL